MPPASARGSDSGPISASVVAKNTTAKAAPNR